ncbi:TIGR00730 family Rossman fold protein [Ruegeria sp.]|uniref:LOG family protein n=1 Tax=Ruegeria sp. TaxID=1879320 RepID=UPI002323C920|nr:TIGR00730 family Rossman fold protein [Ruegeria sp.]MDA7966982.1 TIGR00730 family Rossman fold protein [Ruegeria sp.]
MKQVAVFCGSSTGNCPEYAQAAIDLGTALAKRSITLVYGGGKGGHMGQIADATMAAGGRAVGVMPEALVEREISHPGLTKLHVVPDMATRKSKMSELSDGFIALPGGAGTLEEITEQWTWGQLGIHGKPVAFLNINGFYSHMQAFIAHVTEQGFMKPEYRDMLIFNDTPTGFWI